MSLASFAHCSKCDTSEYKRKQYDIRNRPQFKEADVFIHRLKGETQKGTRFETDFLQFEKYDDGVDSNHEETRELFELLSINLNTNSTFDTFKTIKKRRGYKSNHHSRFYSKKLLPSRERSNSIHSRVKNTVSSFRGQARETSNSLHGDEQQNDLSQQTFLTTIENLECSRQLNEPHPKTKIRRTSCSFPIQHFQFDPSFLKPKAVPFTLRPTRNERAISFQRRNKRIHEAKIKRDSLQLSQMKKIREKIYKKEQKRISHAMMKERESRQELVLRTLLLASTMGNWLSSTPEIIEEFRTQKALNAAATLIQNLWKKELFLRKALVARNINKSLRKISLKLRVSYCCCCATKPAPV